MEPRGNDRDYIAEDHGAIEEMIAIIQRMKYETPGNDRDYTALEAAWCGREPAIQVRPDIENLRK